MNSKDMAVPPGFRDDLPRWRQLVSARWVAALVAGVPIPAAPAKNWRLLEIGFGARTTYLDGHIEGAGYIDSSEFEDEPLWNKVTDAVLLALLLSHGIRHDTTVVLYGRNPLAAARAAHLMLYAGVVDVRLLDGGYAAWTSLDLPLARGTQLHHPEVGDFGAVYPVHPEYLLDTRQAGHILKRADASLVSIRTWNEYIGNTSGYSYIPAKGDIAGSLWGKSGSDDDVNGMSEFHDAHGRMKPAAEIRRMWSANGIRPDKHTVFYCGTGWRASLAFFYAWLMNWERIGVYDGGWCEWSRDALNPMVCRVNAADETFRKSLEMESL
jgi:3-mercaptopyruvate sulfurtransferase SseA